MLGERGGGGIKATTFWVDNYCTVWSLYFYYKIIFQFSKVIFLSFLQPCHYISHLLGHEGKGSLLSDLKTRGNESLTRISITSTNLRLQPAGSVVTVTNNLQMLRAQLSEWLHFLAFINFTKAQFHWLSFSLCWLLRHQHHVWWEAKPLVRWFLFLLWF